jgi:hypothetical protein
MITPIDAETMNEADEDGLCGLFSVMPDDCIIEANISDQGSSTVTDVLYSQGRDLTGSDLAGRVATSKQILENARGAMVLTSSEVVSSAEDLVLMARVAADNGEKEMQIQQAATPYGAPIKRLDLTEVREDLWNYVPPRIANEPRAVFVAGSPNRMEAIRGVPLAGPDGATFRKSYLERMDLRADEIIVIHSQPVTKSDGGDWSAWLSRVMSQYSHLPFVALGRAASTALGDLEHVKMPHPRAIRIQGDRGEVARKSRTVKKSVSDARVRYCPILKADTEKRIVYGVVLEPHTRDLQGDVLTVDTIEIAAHKYLVASRTVGDSHSGPAPAEVVESYLAPADYDLGGHRITKGTWVMGVHILDADLWESVKQGEFTGFSIGGTGERKQLEDLPAK